MQGKPPKKQGFSYPYRTPKSLEKKAKTVQKNKEFLATEKKQGIPPKERKGRTGCSIRATWNRGMACESCPRSLNASDWQLATLPV